MTYIFQLCAVFNFNIVGQTSGTYLDDTLMPVNYQTTYYTSQIDVYNTSAQVNLNNMAQVCDLLGKGADLTSCLNNCSNHGVCKLISGMLYGCFCDPDYIGPSCSVNSRPCSSVPCLNNGTCTEVMVSNGTYNFTCTCLEKYSGSRCEIFDISELCSNLSCVYGTCQVNSSTLEVGCKCFKSYSGDLCDIETTEIKTIKSVITWSSICLLYTSRRG